MYIYVYTTYLSYLKASPLPPPPCQHAVVDWLTAEMDLFFHEKCNVGYLSLQFVNTWCAISAILESRGHPTGTVYVGPGVHLLILEVSFSGARCV